MCPDLPFKGCVDFSFPVCVAVPQFLDNVSTNFSGMFSNLQFHGFQILKIFKILIRYLATSQSSHVSAEKLYTTISKQGILFLNYAKMLGKHHMSLKNCCHSFNLFSPQPILSALWFDSDPLLRKTRVRSKFQNKIIKKCNLSALMFYFPSSGPHMFFTDFCSDMFQKRIYCFCDVMEEPMI